MLREVAEHEKVFCLVWSWQKCFPLLCLYHTRLGCLCAIVRWWEELHCVVVRRKPLLSMRGKHCEARSRFRGEVKARLSEISGQYLFSSPIEKLFAPILWTMTMMTMTTVRWPHWPWWEWWTWDNHDDQSGHDSYDNHDNDDHGDHDDQCDQWLLSMLNCSACITVFSFRSC